MDGGVSTAAIEVLLQNLINFFKEDYSLLRGLDKDAQQLQRTLSIILSYLNDAENKSITQRAAKFWLRELEAVAFEADSVLDEVSYHLLHNKVNKMKAPKKKVISCFSSLNHIARRRKMALTIKQINTTFESMNKRATDLGLQNIVVNAPVAAPHASLETDSFTLDPIFIGRDDDLPILVDKLTHIPEERIFSILAIVGMGGMGKTTLTRKVFNHDTMKTRFGSLNWVHVSQTFDPITIFKKILSTLTSQSSDGVDNREVILKRLQEALKAITYLLVLDDVWNEDLSKWEDFINSLSGVTSTKGNAIIITTRNQMVASIVNPLDIHRLNGLSDEDCWSIIKAKAFEKGEVPSGFEMIGRKIAKRCQGLPLAANVVGGVLRCKSEEGWRFINVNWLSDGEGGENISKILKLSFDHLPSPSLKKCFAYCLIFPKGSEMDRQEVIELWMSEGFLQPDERNEMESVGNKLLNVLLHNSLLLVAERDSYGNVKSYVMHDLVHDLACSILGSSDNADGAIPVRYMIQDKPSLIPKEVTKHLRTLFIKGEEISGTMFSYLNSLRNLTLTSNSRELPNSIRKLIHLKNLNISKTSIENLPEWIGELHQLQTLRSDGWRLRKLPSTLKYLINLRHLYIRDDVELPAEIGRLTCLQTLRYFTVGKEKGYQIEEVGSLKNLKGKLKICGLEKVRDKEEALEANLFQKPNLFVLRFEWGNVRREGERNDESVLEGLQPHANANLKKLGIEGFQGKRFPLWIEKMAVRDGPQGFWVPLNNLIKITLSKCSECEEIPKLEHLPNLKSLSLEGLKKVRFINSSFSKLISLIIKESEGLEHLPDWLFYNNQNLSKLEISGCPLLRELPDGLHTLNSLEWLNICDCPNLRSMGNPSGGGGYESQGILSELFIKRCGGLMELPRQMLESWAPSLEYLYLVDLSSLKNLPVVIYCLTKSARLAQLSILGVPNFMATGRTVESWPFGSLRELKIDVSVEWSRESSVGIKQTVDGILQGCSHSLTQLKLRGVDSWEWVPASIQHLTSLSVLWLENIGVQELPHWFENLSSLWQLSLSGCNKLRRLPLGDALKTLIIKDCPELPIDSEWRNIPHLSIRVDGRFIESYSEMQDKVRGCFR